MKVIVLGLNGKSSGSYECFNNCDDCMLRFKCMTSRGCIEVRQIDVLMGISYSLNEIKRKVGK